MVFNVGSATKEYRQKSVTRRIWRKRIFSWGRNLLLNVAMVSWSGWGGGRQVTEGDRVIGGPFNFSTGIGSGRVSVEKEAKKHFRRIGFGASLALVFIDNGGKVQLSDYFADEACQVVFRKPLLEAWGIR